ncbi:amidohydrolase [Xylariales sp. PMI_506]|nr:amidohydrolase [Xylariales sp. PMI_506]
MAQAIRAARLLPSSSAPLIQNGVVVIEGGCITHVGAWAALKDQLEGIPVQDLGDVTLMSGLFDCHVHLQMDPTNITAGTAITLSDEELLPRMAKNASLLLDAGVTTARDLGSRGPTATQLRDMIARGVVAGPRLQCANAPLTVPGGHCHAMGGTCQGVEGVRAEVRKRKAEGADLVKVMATGGFMTSGTHPSRARFTSEEMGAIADEAHRLGMRVTAHATGTEGIAQVAAAGFDCVEHCAWLTQEGGAQFDEEVARELLKNDVAVCPTMNTACIEHDYFCPWDTREVIISNVSRMRETGLKLVVGTDAGIGLCPFERYADGLTALADAGYTPREIIAGATEDAASACGLSSETGRLEVGLAADMAAFAGNPLEDLTAFSAPRFVMAKGREHTPTPIAPVGDLSETKALIFKTLRAGAGVKSI